MANNTNDRKKDRKVKASSEKKSIGSRIKGFFVNLAAELKRVVWPDKEKLRQNTVTVIAIILAFAFMIWVFDIVVRGAFTVTGFYGKDKPKEMSQIVTNVSQAHKATEHTMVLTGDHAKNSTTTVKPTVPKTTAATPTTASGEE